MPFITPINDNLKLLQNENGLTFGTDAYLLSAFTVGGGGQKIVAVSAARAGFHDHYESGWKTGEYRIRYDKPESLNGRNYIDLSWNLCEADWDAAFIPLNDTTTISASDFKKLIESVGSKDFVPKKDSNKNSKINNELFYQI